MSNDDVRDLAAAFDELHAPRSTAGYADRVPSVDAVDTVYPRRWPQALATVLTVVVALAGAGTFLALRNAREGGTGSAGGYPTARSGAAMAFDSTSGLTVMYGGTSTSGSLLADTWTWNGSAWTARTGPSPGRLYGARMSDDPADGGVLLIGVPQQASQGNGIACVAGGSGGSVGSVTGSVPPASPVGTPRTPLTATPRPTGSPPTTCPTPIAAPTLQTWLFTSRGWTHAAGSRSGSFSADTPSSGAQLAYDSSSGEVVAVSTGAFPECGAPLRSGEVPPSDLICPVAGSSGQSSSTGSAPCSPTVCSLPCRELDTAVNSCLPFEVGMLTWTWAHGQWAQRKGALIPSAFTGVLFGDAQSQHATLVTEGFAGTACLTLPAKPCPVVTPAVAQTAVFSWAGTAWNQSANAGGAPAGLSLAGATVASVGGRAIALTSSGQLYGWSATTALWVHQTGAPQPSGRTGASMAEGPRGSIVLFGGSSLGKASAFVAGGTLAAGADTWTWNGSTWRHVAGPTPPPPTPSPCSDVTGLGSNACARPPSLPAHPPSTGAPKQSSPIGA